MATPALSIIAPTRRRARGNGLLRRLLAITLVGVLWSSRAAAEGNNPDKDAGPGDDVVETLDDSEPSAPARGKVEKKEEAPVDKIDFRGFTRFTLGAGLFPARAAPNAGQNVENVGYDRGFGETHGYFDLRYSRGKSFQAVLSGSLAYSAYLTEFRPGSDTAARAADFSFFEPTLREAYLAFFSDRIDVRIGQQRIVWGNSDGITPNDVLNARDLRERLQLDTEMIHQPTLAARADFDLGVASLGIVAQPFFVPDRFSLYGGNWSLVQPDAPRVYRRLFGLYAKGRDRALVQDVQDILSHARTPRVFPDGASLGTSLKFHFDKLDTSYYYEYGYDRSPFVYLDPTLQTQLDQFDPAQVNGAILDAFIQQLQTAQATYGGPLVVQYLRRHHVGADAATTVGPFVLRLDGAYDSLMSLTARSTLNSVAKPVAQGVFGVEYQTGDLNKIVVLETWYMRVLGPKVPVVPQIDQSNYGELLFYQDDNVGFSNLVRWSFFENVIFEMRTFLGVAPFWYMLRPEIGYGSPSLSARLGFLLLEGSDPSYGHYYRRNDTAYVTVRYSF
jgi:hypothetical protein